MSSGSRKTITVPIGVAVAGVNVTLRLRSSSSHAVSSSRFETPNAGVIEAGPERVELVARTVGVLPKPDEGSRRRVDEDVDVTRRPRRTTPPASPADRSTTACCARHRSRSARCGGSRSSSALQTPSGNDDQGEPPFWSLASTSRAEGARSTRSNPRSAAWAAIRLEVVGCATGVAAPGDQLHGLRQVDRRGAEIAAPHRHQRSPRQRVGETGGDAQRTELHDGRAGRIVWRPVVGRDRGDPQHRRHPVPRAELLERGGQVGHLVGEAVEVAAGPEASAAPSAGRAQPLDATAPVAATLAATAAAAAASASTLRTDPATDSNAVSSSA